MEFNIRMKRLIESLEIKLIESLEIFSLVSPRFFPQTIRSQISGFIYVPIVRLVELRWIINIIRTVIDREISNPFA